MRTSITKSNVRRALVHRRKRRDEVAGNGQRSLSTVIVNGYHCQRSTVIVNVQRSSSTVIVNGQRSTVNVQRSQKSKRS